MNCARLRMNRWRRSNCLGEKPKCRAVSRSIVRWLAPTRSTSSVTLASSGSITAAWIA